MQKNEKIFNLFDEKESIEITNSGISKGIELLADNNIVLNKLFEQKNGDNENINSFLKRYSKSELNSNDKLIINKYKAVK